MKSNTNFKLMLFLLQLVSTVVVILCVVYEYNSCSSDKYYSLIRKAHLFFGVVLCAAILARFVLNHIKFRNNESTVK